MRTKDQDPIGPEDTSSKSTNNGQDSPGYETTDVNVGGVIVFLAGLSGFLLIFFFFCFGMGKVINSAFLKQDGPANRWNQNIDKSMSASGGKRQDLASNPEVQQRELAQMTKNFPGPRLQTDDGNQDTADLHAREDLLLDHYSSDPDDPSSIRIPIAQAMKLIAQRGLPLNQTATAGGTVMVGDATPQVTVPLTDGFARTGYELDVMEARAQKMSYGRAEAATHAELKPSR